MNPHRNYIAFDPDHGVWLQRLPSDLCSSNADFRRLWKCHPAEFPTIFLHGRKVKLPRWQQAYGRDYHFSGQSSKAQPIPELLQPYLDWAQANIDSKLNGLLLNWYDAKLGHYIGAHRDSCSGLVDDSHIVMMSLGESRMTRFRPVAGSGFRDIEATNGDVLIMPLTTNQLYKHEVPKFKRYKGKRISITLRCFAPEV